MVERLCILWIYLFPWCGNDLPTILDIGGYNQLYWLCQVEYF